MNTKHYSIIAIAVCTLVLIGSIAMAAFHKSMFGLEGTAAFIAGTLGALFISYPLHLLAVAVRVAINTYRSRVPSAQSIVDSLLQLSLQSRLEGMLALEEDGERASVLFLKRALAMLVDGFSGDELREALQTEIHFFQTRRAMHECVFRHTAKLAIALGILGTILEVGVSAAGNVGIVGLFPSVGNTENLSHSMLAICVPLIAGILVAYFLCIPIAENIHAKTQEELLIHKLIAEGVRLIAQECNILKLQTRLQSFITPHERDIQHMSIKEIRDRYEELKNSRLEP